MPINEQHPQWAYLLCLFYQNENLTSKQMNTDTVSIYAVSVAC